MGGDDAVVEVGMKTIQPKDPGLFDHENRMKKLAEGPDPLARLNARIEWEMFRSPLERAFEKEARGPGGRPRHDVVLMFKVLVLQRYSNLSDEQTEYQINDRLSFQKFLGLTLSDSVPDQKTKADKTTKLIEDYEVTDASVHDSQVVEDLVEETDGTLHADSAYTGETIEDLLEENGVKGEICEKGYRGHPLTERQKKSNRKKSKIRVRVEHIFGVHDEYDEGRVEDEVDRDEEDCRRGWAIESGVQHGPVRADCAMAVGVVSPGAESG